MCWRGEVTTILRELEDLVEANREKESRSCKSSRRIGGRV
jgi:hypothetical protein